MAPKGASRATFFRAGAVSVPQFALAA